MKQNNISIRQKAFLVGILIITASIVQNVFLVFRKIKYWEYIYIYLL